MKYLKQFNERSQYDAYISNENPSPFLPNVSLVNNESHELNDGTVVKPTVHYNRFVAPQVNCGWICYYDGNNLKLCSPSDYSSINGGDGIIPVGVVVVPSNHLSDGTVRICAKKDITSRQWASVSGYDVTELTNMSNVPTFQNTLPDRGTTGWASYAYLPSDIGGALWSGSTCINDSGTTYYGSATSFIPSPYNIEDGSKNAIYSASHGSPDNNALNDFNGLENTTLLNSLNGVEHEYLSGSTPVVTAINYTAAVDCFNYSVPGTEGLIQWYLPACGELAYVVPRRKVIQDSLALIGTGGSFVNGYYWSSSEASAAPARLVGMYDGRVSYYCYKSDSYLIRPFFRLAVSPFCFWFNSAMIIIKSYNVYRIYCCEKT